MHENREISSTPWSDDQGRSAKAISRNGGLLPVCVHFDEAVLRTKLNAGRVCL
jgi:hypothetical protein